MGIQHSSTKKRTQKKHLTGKIAPLPANFSQTMPTIQIKPIQPRIIQNNLIANHEIKTSGLQDSLINQYVQSTLVPYAVAQRSSVISKESTVLNCKNKFRRSFVLEERLVEDESYSMEYKNYMFAFGPEIRKKLKVTICAFINTQGGRILIGVTDDKRVRGIRLTGSERDVIKRDILSLTCDFDPSIKTKDRIKVYFVPIKRTGDNQVIPGLFVVKIVVKQGDPSELYCDSTTCAIRGDAFNQALSLKDIMAEKEDRRKQPVKKVPDEEFDDPEPEQLVDIWNDEQESMKKSYAVKVSDLPLELTEDMLRSMMYKNNILFFVSCRMPNKGYCWINFSSLEGAQKFVQEIAKQMFPSSSAELKKEFKDKFYTKNARSDKDYIPRKPLENQSNNVSLTPNAVQVGLNSGQENIKAEDKMKLPVVSSKSEKFTEENTQPIVANSVPVKDLVDNSQPEQSKENGDKQPQRKIKTYAVKLSSLPMDMTEEMVRDLINKGNISTVASCKMPASGYCWVNFSTLEDAQKFVEDAKQLFPSSLAFLRHQLSKNSVRQI